MSPSKLYLNDYHNNFTCNTYNLEATQMSFNGQVKLWFKHTKEYLLVIKRNKLLINATTWINLQRIMLSQKDQQQTVTHWIVYHTTFLKRQICKNGV